MTTAVRITNDKIATEYLAEHASWAVVTDGKVEQSGACERCGGSGRGPWFQDGGICYRCLGKNTKGIVNRIPVKAFAQKIQRQLKSQEKARQKRLAQKENQLEGQRDWSERNGHGRLTFAELDQKRAEEREAKKGISQHVGDVKSRQTFELTLTFAKSFDGFYGMTWIHRFEDQDGNVFVWKTKDLIGNSKRCFENGESMEVTATVKKHSDYQGEKQTELSRVKVIEK